MTFPVILGWSPALLDAYAGKVMATERANLIGFWPQNEPSGSVSYDRSGNAHNGAYTGVTLGQPGVPGMGYTCPYFDGTNDYNNIHSAALAAAFNGAEGTLIQAVKVSDWVAAGQQKVFRLGTDGSDYLQAYKYSANFRIDCDRGGVAHGKTHASQTATGFFFWAVTWSETADEIIYYIDGSATETDTTIGTWANTTNAVVLGALNLTPTDAFDGWLGPTILYSKALTGTQIAYLSAV